MSNVGPLLPDPRVVHEKLTINQRERRALRTLLKLILDARQDKSQSPLETRQAPSRVGGSR